MADKTPDFTESMLSSKTVYHGNLLHVQEDQVRLPDGKTARREYIRHRGAAAMVPFLDPETVVLVRQYRYPLARHFYEIPAGKIDRGEEPLATARRGLREECGYEAGGGAPPATIPPRIRYFHEAVRLLPARGPTPGGGAARHRGILRGGQRGF